MTAPRPRSGRTPAPDDLSRGLMTLDEYFALAEASDVKYEYVRGQVFAMSRPRRMHGRITMNIAAKLYAAAGDGPCRVYQDVGVLIDGEILYGPDVMVACGPEPDDDDRFEHAPFVLTLGDIYRGVTFPPPQRVREASPGWGDEEVPAWMLEPAEEPPAKLGAAGGAGHAP